MKVFKYFVDFSKEERWLQSMLEKGYVLTKKSWLYEFQHCDDKTATVRVDYRTFTNDSEFESYKTLFADSGWKLLAGTKHSGTQYFLQQGKKSDDIFSDAYSRAGRYRRLSDTCLAPLVVFFGLFVITLNSTGGNLAYFFNPKGWYVTPGLWELNGTEFLYSFLFETPFALLRGGSWIMSLVMIAVYAILYAKYDKMYKKAIK